MTAESIVLLLTNSRDTIPAKVDGEDDIKLDNPALRWKRMIGHKDPDDAKAQKFEETQDTLRGLYGVDMIKNGFHGSDDAKAANKERDIFLFPIPDCKHKIRRRTQRCQKFTSWTKNLKKKDTIFCK